MLQRRETLNSPTETSGLLFLTLQKFYYALIYLELKKYSNYFQSCKVVLFILLAMAARHVLTSQTAQYVSTTKSHTLAMTSSCPRAVTRNFRHAHGPTISRKIVIVFFKLVNANDNSRSLTHHS